MRCHFCGGEIPRTRLQSPVDIWFGGIAVREAKIAHGTLHHGQAAIDVGFGVVVGEEGFRRGIFIPERGRTRMNKISGIRNIDGSLLHDPKVYRDFSTSASTKKSMLNTVSSVIVSM
jgi:hypothetical protein